MKKNWKTILIALIGISIVTQFIPVTRDNPAVAADFDGPADVKAVVTVSCYDCHSNETKWPAYSRVAPIAWLIAHDVHEGRSRLNFSDWGSYDDETKAFYRKQIYKETSGGEMPPLPYTFMHSQASLTPASLETLKNWQDLKK